MWTLVVKHYLEVDVVRSYYYEAYGPFSSEQEAQEYFNIQGFIDDEQFASYEILSMRK